MKGQDLLNGMNFVEDSYVEEAEAKSISKKKKAKPVWKSIGLVAACVILIVAACVALPRLGSKSGTTPSGDLTQLAEGDGVETPGTEQTGTVLPGTDESLMAEEPKTIEIDLSDIYVNALEMNMTIWDIGRNYPDPDACVDSIWYETDVIDYYGTNFVPDYIPEGLVSDASNREHRVVLSNEGEVWEDTVWLNFYEEYYEDGSPKTDRGFHIMASKIGLLDDACFIYPTPHEEITYFGETEVSIGYMLREYGPYTEDTHEPAGYYDYYEVRFTLNGAECKLVASRLTVEEVVKVVASLIYDSGDIVTVGEAKMP